MEVINQDEFRRRIGVPGTMANRTKLFISYSHKDLRWLHAVKEQLAVLERQGLVDIFEDTCLQAGDAWYERLHSEMLAAKVALLLVSAPFLSSGFIRDEEVPRLFDRHASSGMSIFPLLIRPCAWQQVPWLSTLQLRPQDKRRRPKAVSSYVGAARDQALADVATEIARLVTSDQFRTTAEHSEFVSGTVEIPDKTPVPSGHGLKVAALADVLSWGWDSQKLLEELIRLDYETVPGLTAAHEGDASQWGPIFFDHPETWRLLVDEPKRVLGYWHFAPLFDREYRLAKSGRLLDSQINSNSVRLFELPGSYNVYFAQLCMIPQHRSPRSLQLLFSAFFEMLGALARSDIYIREIVANAYTEHGQSMCRSFDMKPQANHVQRGVVYSAPMGKILRHPLARRFAALIQRYRDQGLA